MLSVEAQLLIYNDIKRINKIKDYDKRVNEIVVIKQQIVAALNDDIDELLSGIDLTKPAKEEVEQAVVNKVVQMSIAFDEEDQLRMDREELIDNVGKHMEGLYWYDKQMMELYIKLGNYRAIEKATGIPYSSAFKTIQKVIKEIKQKVLR